MKKYLIIFLLLISACSYITKAQEVLLALNSINTNELKIKSNWAYECQVTNVTAKMININENNNLFEKTLPLELGIGIAHSVKKQFIKNIKVYPYLENGNDNKPKANKELLFHEKSLIIYNSLKIT